MNLAEPAGKQPREEHRGACGLVPLPWQGSGAGLSGCVCGAAASAASGSELGSRGGCNLLLQYVPCLMLRGNRETGTRLWHQIPQQFIFKPSDKALQEYSQVTEPAHDAGVGFCFVFFFLGNTKETHAASL